MAASRPSIRNAATEAIDVSVSLPHHILILLTYSSGLETSFPANSQGRDDRRGFLIPWTMDDADHVSSHEDSDDNSSQFFILHLNFWTVGELACE